jgi:hypothetical protein
MNAYSNIRILARAALCLSLALTASLAASAQEARSVAALCAPYYGELVANGKAVRTSDAGLAQLLPLGPASDPIRAAIAADRPGILVETAFLLPRKGAAGLLAEQAQIYGLLRSFSTLEGIQYYSVTHKSMRTLYAESYRIDAPETKLRLPDPAAPQPSEVSSASETLFAFQRDLSFGANTYSYDFRAVDGGVTVEITNLTRMSYGIIPLVAPKALKTRLLVLPASDGILFYAESDSASPGPFRSKLEESFKNRAIALFGWFSSRSAAFVKR